MTIDPYILTFALLTVVATVWMGFWSARKSKTASDFYVAGRSVSVGWNASAISGEYLSAASFMGVAGMVMSSGYDALWYPVCYACGYLFLLLFIAGPLRRFGAYTIPDFAEGRFDSPLFRKVAVVFVLFIGFFYTMPQMKGAGTTLAYIFPGLPYGAGVVLVGAVITLNVALGGMKGVTLVQAFQYWAKMFAISVPAFVLMAVYGHYGKQLEVNSPESRAIKYPPMLLRNADTIEDFPRKLSIPEAFYEYARLTQQKPLHSGSLGLDQLDKLLGGRLTAHHLLRGPPLPTNQLEFTTPISALLPEEAFSSLKPTDVSMSLAPARDGTDVAFIGIGNPTPEEVARSLTKMFVRLPRSQRVLDLWKALNDQDVELVPVGKDYVIARVREPKPRTASTTDGHQFKVQGSEFKVESSAKSPTDLSLAPPESVPMKYTTSMKYLETKVAGVPVSIEQTATNFTGRLVIGTNPIAIPNAAANAIYRHETNRTRREFDSAKTTMYAELGVTDANSTSSPSFKVATDASEIPRGFIQASPPQPRPVKPLAEIKLAVELALQGQKYGMSSFITNFLTNDLANYGQYIAHMEVLVSEELKSRTLPPFKINSHTTRGVAVEFKRMLETNGMTIRETPEGRAWVIPIARLPELEALLVKRLTSRKPLTEKAPADSTWLNPFGPLTTKAAKAAGLSIEQQRPYSLLYTYSLIIALVCGTAGLPHILVRFYTNPDGVAAKRTTMWVMILIGVFYLFPPVFGVMGRNLLPELYNGLSGVKGTDGIVLKLPLILKERFGQLGPILSGITCAGAFAAFMSTFSGLLVSITGALAHDIYGRILRPQSTSEQRMRAFKVCAVICGSLAVALGFLVESFEINKLVGWAFAIAATSYFPLLFLSTWWRSITMKGAATGMLVGGTLSLTTVVSTMLADQAKWAEPLKNWFAHHPLERTLAEQPAIWALPLAIGLMILVSKITRKEIPADVRMKMLVLHAPEKLGLKQEYIQEHQHGH